MRASRDTPLDSHLQATHFDPPARLQKHEASGGNPLDGHSHTASLASLCFSQPPSLPTEVTHDALWKSFFGLFVALISNLSSGQRQREIDLAPYFRLPGRSRPPQPPPASSH